MIANDQERRALASLHRLLVLVRMDAYEEQAHAKIAKVLDTCEYLVVLMSEAEDRRGEFLAQLRGLAASDSRYTQVLELFEG